MSDAPRRLSLWSGPRNVSTALMYSFRQRADTRIVDEPLYGHYLRVTNAPHPGASEIMASMDSDGARVVKNVLLGPSDRPVVFFKNMAHHLVGLEHGFFKAGFLARLDNIILTRDPREMLPSLAQLLSAPCLRDTGLTEQVALLDFELTRGREPVVLEAQALLEDPKGVLCRLCARLGLAFDPAMLAWPAGPKPEDGVWAKDWYGGVHASSGFAPYRPKEGPFPEQLEGLLEACAPLYARLRAHAL